MDPIYGMHLMLRIGDIADGNALNSERNVSEFLVKLIERLNMRILSGPITGTETGDSKAGCSGVIILYESHAAIHTYSERKEAFLDVFSCKPYDEAWVIKTLEEYFGPFKVSERAAYGRGIHWNAEAQAAYDGWVRKR